MNAEIIAIGSELLTPQRIDTNSLYLTEKLNQVGFEVVRKTIVGDDRVRLADELRQARNSSELVITSGGIGPTLDDLTRDAASDALGRTLVFDPSVVEQIEERFRRFNRKMAEINKRQAYILEGAEILPNPNGTAPGQYFQDEKGILIILPGPPRELQPMFEQQCLPRLLKLDSPDKYFTATLRVSLMAESEVDERIGPIYSAEARVATTILASPGDIQVHLRAKAATIEEARDIAEALALKVEAELGKPVYSRAHEALVNVVARLFRERQLTVATAESCTGGLLAETITSLAGSSEYFRGGFVSYTERAKIDTLGVPAGTIRDHGVYSAETAEQMALAARRKLDAALGVGITGVAGPDGGSDEIPVGTVFIALADQTGTTVAKRNLGGDRERIRGMATLVALEMLRRRILGIE
ncbi:MAG: competence/damage-inducible protein A [Bryobacterales bacterium]